MAGTVQPRGAVQNEERLDIAVAMPIPHAMLCNSGAWVHWGFPVAAGRKAGGLGLHIVSLWLSGIDRNAQHHGVAEEGNPTYQLSEDFLQGLADIMRAQLAGVANLDEVTFYMSWVQNLRSVMLRNKLGLSKRIYCMTEMVHSMIMSGLLASRDGLQDVVVAGIETIIREEAVQAFYLDMLKHPCALPSQSTLYRHRLTIHMAYCKIARLPNSRWLTCSRPVMW